MIFTCFSHDKMSPLFLKYDILTVKNFKIMNIKSILVTSLAVVIGLLVYDMAVKKMVSISSYERD